MASTRRWWGGGTTGGGVRCCWWTPTPPQIGHCWSNLTVVSGIYLPIVRAVWMGPLTDPKFVVSTTSTHQNLSKPPPSPPPSHHPHPPRVRCFGHSTRFLTPYGPTNSQRGVTRRLPALRVLGISGIRPKRGQGRQNVLAQRILNLIDTKNGASGPQEVEIE